MTLRDDRDALDAARNPDRVVDRFRGRIGERRHRRAEAAVAERGANAAGTRRSAQDTSSSAGLPPDLRLSARLGSSSPMARNAWRTQILLSKRSTMVARAPGP